MPDNLSHLERSISICSNPRAELFSSTGNFLSICEITRTRDVPVVDGIADNAVEAILC